MLSPRIPKLCAVPAATFLMGLSNDQLQLLIEDDPEAVEWEKKGRLDREKPSHHVSVLAFSLAQAPVTYSDYQLFVQDGGYHNASWWTSAGWQWRMATDRVKPALWRDTMHPDDDTHPVVGVSWYEAVAYCRWLNRQTSIPFRLPTEAEWEFAARGVCEHLYPWGNTFSANRCNTRAAGVGHTLPIGKAGAGDSPFGVQDMIGNVSEWTSSQFLPYPYMSTDGREELDAAGERTTRGGSWFSPNMRARATSRGMNDPWFSDNDLGFRVATSETSLQLYSPDAVCIPCSR